MAKDKTLVVEPQVELQKLAEKYQLSVTQLAEGIGISLSGARQILTGKSRITVPIGLKLAKYFSNKTEDYWVKIQTQYDIAQAKNDSEFATGLKNINPAQIPEKKPAPAKAKAPARPKKEPTTQAKPSKSTAVKGKSSK
jgi:addiction module HigA family antidote